MTPDVELECTNCKIKFMRTYKQTYDIRVRKHLPFCTRKCSNIYKSQKITINCRRCGKERQLRPSVYKKYKNHYCSTSCWSIYENVHKTRCYQRSKLEKFLEEKLLLIYDFEIIFNERKLLDGLELDIYIPHLQLAFEINGIVHYEPIWGLKNFNDVSSRDNRKFQLCIQKEIELCIIDSSGFKYWKEKKALEFLEIVTNIINQKISRIKII